MIRPRFARVALAFAVSLATASAGAVEPWRILAQSKKQTPQPPWPAGDERGMANQIGRATWARCAWHLGNAKAKAYELSHARSNTMPLSAFSGPYVQKPKPTASIPGSAHAFNLEQYEAGAEPGQQARRSTRSATSACSSSPGTASRRSRWTTRCITAATRRRM